MAKNIFEEIDAATLNNPKPFSGTVKKGGGGTKKALAREVVTKRSKQPINIANPATSKRIGKGIIDSSRGIRFKHTQQPKPIPLDVVAKVQRKHILSPTVFQIKMRNNIEKKKKPITFFGKGRV